MTSKGRRWPRFGPLNGLVFQLVAILTIAMLPLGLISVFQTSKIFRETQSLSATALLQRTTVAANEVRELIQSAIGAADAFAAAVPVLAGDPDNCDDILEQLVESERQYIIAGYVDGDGRLICSSSRQRVDLSGSEVIGNPADNQVQRIETRPIKALGGETGLSVGSPVFSDGDFQGSMWLALSYERASEALISDETDADLVVFDTEGKLLAIEAFSEDRGLILPKQRNLSDLARGGTQTFRGINHADMPRDFAVVPIIRDRVYVLGSWNPEKQGVQPGYSRMFALYFPFLMWGIALLVAYFGINRLVLRHIRRLQQWMRLYTAGRLDFDDARLQGAPEELEIVAGSFRAMTRRLTEHEHRREEELAEKTVLLREVHHRVKNNLQMISSIMNMQIRSAQSVEARNLLRRVQDRVMALAAIHRYLYTARRLSMVRADQLLDDIIGQLVLVGVDEAERQINISTHFSEVDITPDQSVPLSLLAAEASTNAVKYCGAPAGEQPSIQIVLTDLGDRRLCLSVVNSRGPQAPQQSDEAATGLGGRLIQSFVVQLDGKLEIRDLPDRYELHVTFAIADPVGSDLPQA